MNQGTASERRIIRGSDRSPELVEALLGEGMVVTGFDFPEDPGSSDIIHITSARSLAVCTCCGRVTTQLAKGGGFIRKIEYLPLRPGRQASIHLHGRQFICANPDCKAGGFREQPDFTGKFRRRSFIVDALVILISAFASCSGCSLILRLLGPVLSADTVQNLLSTLEFKDDPHVRRIGVDDVANRKGISYFTIIYDLDARRCLALLDGRDGGQFKDWLLKHKEVELVCRDRASAYASAVDAVCHEQGRSIVQVADRFHLLQNMLGHLKDELYCLVPLRIAFEIATSQMLGSIPAKTVPESALIAESALVFEYDNTPPCIEGETVEFSVPSYKSGKQKEKQEKGRREKVARIKAIRGEFDPLQKKGPQLKALAAKHGCSQQTVRNYLNMSVEDIDAILAGTGWKKKEENKEIDKYKYVIYKMIAGNHTMLEIVSTVKHMGYPHGIPGLMLYVQEICRSQFPGRLLITAEGTLAAEYPDTVKVFTRTQIFRALVAQHEPSKDKEIEPYLDAILEKYPLCGEIRDTFKDFYDVIMGEDADELDALIEKYRDSRLGGFWQSIERDRIPIRNAILYTYSSGFVEGCNHKFKLIKRILYGRCGLKNLEIRTKLAFDVSREGFSLQALLPW